MAGHRKVNGRRERQQPGATVVRRIHAAQTAEEQLSAAFDLFRVRVKQLPAEERRKVMYEITQLLANCSLEVEAARRERLEFVAEWRKRAAAAFRLSYRA